MAPDGWIYVLHFSRPLGGPRHFARHYVGWTRDVALRVGAHEMGAGAKITAAAAAKGISFEVVHARRGTREIERALHRGGHLAALCEHCRPDYLAGRRRRG